MTNVVLSIAGFAMIGMLIATMYVYGILNEPSHYHNDIVICSQLKGEERNKCIDYAEQQINNKEKSHDRN